MTDNSAIPNSPLVRKALELRAKNPQLQGACKVNAFIAQFKYERKVQRAINHLIAKGLRVDPANFRSACGLQD